MLSVSVVIPVFNEEEIIASAIDATYHSLSKLNCDFEIVIVDDGSTDKSVLIIERCIPKYQHTILYKKNKNQGLGATFRTGLALTKKEMIICVPADSPLDEETLSLFIEHKEKADILVSYRIARLGYTFWMQLNSILFHFIVSTLFGMKLKDYNWIHMYNRKIFAEGSIKIEFNGLFMLAEILIKAKRKGFTFYEFPVHQKQRLTGIASASKLVNVYKTLRDILIFSIR